MLETSDKKLDPDETDRRFSIIRHKVSEVRIEETWKRFTEAGFKMILIKGWAAAQLYPEPFRRNFVDIDLMCAPEVYKAAVEFAEQLKKDFPVDLHCGARHLDKVDFENLYVNSRTAKCGAAEIRVLRPEDHLRILCVHWLNDGGGNRERLRDIYYGVANRPADFDWDRFLNIVDARRRRWLVCAVGLAHKYLNLDLERTPIAEEAKVLPPWLVRAVEKEWASDVRLLPLHFFWKDKKNLWKQIRKRVPPNPIQATIEMEGDFDSHIRLGYQIRNMLLRLSPSIKRIKNNSL